MFLVLITLCVWSFAVRYFKRVPCFNTSIRFAGADPELSKGGGGGGGKHYERRQHKLFRESGDMLSRKF